MRSVLAFLVSLAFATPVHAQPGPSAPLELTELRALANRIRRDEATLASATRDANARIHAAHDAADAVAHLSRRVSNSPAAGGPSSIAAGAEAELRAITGLTFEKVAPAVPLAWQRCADEVRALHALDDGARECLAEVTRYTPAFAAHEGYALPAPAGFVASGATPAATQAIYRATQARLAAHADDVAARRALAAMQLATGDYGAVVATLAALAGDYDADVTAALATGAIDAVRADALFAALIHREPARPEAYYDRALLAVGRANSSEDVAVRTAQFRLQFEMLRAFLCTSGAARLPGPPRVVETAARDAESVQWQVLGGSHWSWRTGEPRPPPFLPEELLPPSMHDGPLPGPTPSATCADVLGTQP